MSVVANSVAGDQGHPAQAEPSRDALRSWPTSVRAKANAVLIAVATAPPKRFAGGGYWEAVQGEMTGWFEVRIDGPKRRRLCGGALDGRGVPETHPALDRVTSAWNLGTGTQSVEMTSKTDGVSGPPGQEGLGDPRPLVVVERLDSDPHPESCRDLGQRAKRRV